MGKAYHILLIGNEESDIDLIQTELSKLDIQVQIDIIQKEEQLIDRLENNPPDLVISDNNIPSLPGTDALQIVQDQHPQLPFILVAGSIGQEKAINIILQGASDYAMKQNMDRLGPAVLRELANYEDHKKQSRRLEETRNRYENLVTSVNGIVWEADAETLEFLYVSPQSEQLLGYTPEEWLGEPNFWKEHLHPDDRREAILFCQHQTQQGDDHTFEYRMLDANDEIVWVRDYVTVITENGKPNRLHGLLIDISKEKKAEGQRDKAYEIADIGHWELDVKNGELYWSNTVKQLHEVGPGYEPTLDTGLAFYKEGEHRQKITKAVENAIETGEPFEEELQIITQNGNKKWVRVVGETEFRNGECVRIYGSTQDISKRKQAEQKLQLSEQKFKSLVQSGASMIAVLNEEGIFTYVSENYEQITGWPSEELIGKNAFGFMHPDDKDRVQTRFRKLQTEKENQHSLPYRFKHKEGHWIWKESIASDLSHSSALNGYVINSHDVTERRYYTALEKMERDILEENITGKLELPELAERLLLKLENLHPCMTCSIHKVVDDKLQSLASPNLPSDYLDKIEGLEIGPHAGSCGTAAYLKEPVIAENIYENPSWEGYRHLGDKYDFSACWSKPILDSNQNVVATFAIYYKTPQAPSEHEKNTIDRVVHLLRLLFDSFEKQKAEQKLALREQRFKSLVQDGSDLIAILDQNGNYKYVAPTSESVLGISAEEFIGNNALNYIHDKHKGRIQQVLATLPEKKRIKIKPFLFKDGKGEWRWIETIMTNLLDNPAIEGFLANSRDVTAQIEREQKLKESLELYEYVTKATDDVVFDWDLTEDILNWDDSFHEKFIYPIEEDTYSIDDWAQNVHPEDRPEAQKSLNNLLESSKSKWEQEYRFKKQDGTYATVFERGFVIRDQNGDAIRMIGSLQDISDRKEYEEELKELALVASKTTDVIFMTDPQEQITWVNNAFEQFSGYQFDEVIGKSPGNILTGPDNDQQTMKSISNAFKKQEALQVIVLNYSKTGDKYWFDLTLDPIFDSNGQCEGFIGIQKNVTEQIEYQQELRKSVERYDIVSKATSDTVWDWDLATDKINYSQNFYDMFGFEQQQVDETENWWRTKIHPDDLSGVFENIEKAQRSSSERFQLEYRFKAADGSYKDIFDRAFIVEDPEGNPIRIIGAMRDVSDQKEAQYKIKEAFQERERILDRISEAFFATDQNWNVTYWNKQAEEVIGVTRDDVLGKNLWEKFPAIMERKFLKEYKRAFQEQVTVQFEEYYPPREQWLEVTAYPSEEGLSVFFRDITERRETEQSLEELYQRNRLVLESTDEGIYGIDNQGYCTFINKAAANMLGYRPEECIGENMHKLIHHKYSNGELYPESECPIYISKNKHESCRVIDEVFWRADGTCFDVEYSSNPMIKEGEIKGAVVAFADITERKQHEKELRESLKESETLLMEIHHRVKNNLAVVSGMMQLQAYKEEDENIKQKLNDAVNRIQTMGNIHELLYQSESFSRIDAHKNIRKLVVDIVNTFQIAVELDIEFDLQKISLNINQAIPLSLLINEVITNVMKHAFLDRNQGIMSVSLAEEDNIINIHIKDNGQGLPDNFEKISENDSLGLQLINTLSTQLRGEYSYESLDEGTLFTFSFEKADVKGVGNARLN